MGVCVCVCGEIPVKHHRKLRCAHLLFIIYASLLLSFLHGSNMMLLFRTENDVRHACENSATAFD